MATHNETGITSLPAAADFSALTSSYRLVVRNGSGQAALCGAGARPFGQMDGDSVPAGRQTRIQKFGGKAQLKCEAGGVIAVGDLVGSDGTGRLVEITAAGGFVIGEADEIGAVGQIVSYSPNEPYPLPAP